MIFGKSGILGINARNLLYIRPYNDKKAIKLADDKIKTKQFLEAREIPVPKLYAVIRDKKELDKFDFNALPPSFVLKPNNGYGGEGIVPVVSHRGKHFFTPDNKVHTREELVELILDILDGRFSISNIGDYAFFEQYIVADDVIGKYSYAGLPDIRVIVHNLIPVMAMLRLPTRQSRGKANLHQGAVGVGIDIAKGEATHIVHHNKIIDELPNNLGPVRGLKIPFWDDILHIASKVQLITNLGYLAADICIDKNVGPVLLEINARAGLNVQIANLAPLAKRLERIEGVKVTTPQKGVRIAKDMFGNMVEKEIEHISGKQIIGLSEEVDLIHKKGNFKLLAKVDTGKSRSILDSEVASKLGLLDNNKDYDDEKSILKIKFALKNKRIQTVVDIEKIPSEKYQFIVGSRDLNDFLLDTNIKKQTDKPQPENKISVDTRPKKNTVNYAFIDRELAEIDEKIKLLYHLRPINLESEKRKFLTSLNENPKFEYPKLKFDPLELIDRLQRIVTDDSALGNIFQKKKNEIALKIELLESIDETKFSGISIKLFGQPREEEVALCEKTLWDLDLQKLSNEKEGITSSEAQKEFENTFRQYGLNEWKVELKDEMVADCVAGKNNRMFIRKDAKFSARRLKNLIIHEIETHILTAENGKQQPYKIFNIGFADYLQTQEGLAMYNTEKYGDAPFEENYKAMAHVIAINWALNHSFVEVFEKILEFGLPMEQAFRSALKAKRGMGDTTQQGAFTKDYLYWRGYHDICEFIKKGGKISDLYLGKITVRDIANIKNIPGLEKPKHLPLWLKN